MADIIIVFPAARDGAHSRHGVHGNAFRIAADARPVLADCVEKGGGCGVGGGLIQSR